MAITRAQQVKQMLREGGRIEFRRGGIDRGFQAPSKAGQSPRGTDPYSGPPTKSGGSGSISVGGGADASRTDFGGPDNEPNNLLY